MLVERIKNTIRNVPDFPKAGINFKDITPILQDPLLCADIVEEFAKKLDGIHIDAICGIESRGFLFGFALAARLNLPFVLIRKAGKLPSEKVEYSYELEYGSAVVELQKGDIKKGMNVLIHDDLLASGGTAVAASELIKMLGGNVAGFAFVLELVSLEGKKRLISHSPEIISLIEY